jgi:dTDP-4-dehydrorhamnose 3,5-epimerase-like enzyme
MSVKNAKIISIQRSDDPRGTLCVIEGNSRTLPYEIKRIYYIFDVAEGADRGHHAMKTQDKFLIAVSGSFDVVLKDGGETAQFHLSKPDEGLLIPGGLWREMKNFSPGAVCLVLASDVFIERDHIRSYEDFLEYIENLQQNFDG